MPPVINIAIVEDHPIVRDSLARMISLRGTLRVVGTAGNLKNAASLLESANPDVVLADLSLEDGSAIELARRATREHRTARFLIMTGFCNEFSATDAFDAGVAGFILKKQPSADFFTAIDRVAAGGVYVSPLLLAAPRRRCSSADVPENPLSRLSKREGEIFRMVVAGSETKQIAGRLVISIKTVETHRTSINRKLGVTSTASLLRFAVAHGIEINPRPGGS